MSSVSPSEIGAMSVSSSWKAVGAASKNVEIEIDFGGSELFHCLHSNTTPTMTDKLILALDVDRADEALALVRLLKPHLSLFKVGNQLFTREGPAFVKALRAEGVDIFLDQKWHDIPQTVATPSPRPWRSMCATSPSTPAADSKCCRPRRRR
jgi:hypothetical protein